MGRKILLSLLICLVAVMSISAESKKPVKLSEAFKSDWKIVNERMLLDSLESGVVAEGLLRISALDNGFIYSRNSWEKNREGIYQLEDSVLTMAFFPADTSISIDSGVFKIINRHPQMVFFKQGKRVSSLTDGILTTDTVVYTARIMKCDNNFLVLADDEKITTFKKLTYDAVVSANGGFGFKSLLRGMLGLFVILGLAFLFSANRKAISWRLVGFGILTQIVIAFAVLKVPLVQNVFEFMGRVFIKILDFSKVGGDFLFESMVTGKVEVGLINFAFQILPTIIFFSALTSILYYYGVIQKVVYVMAWLLKKILRISGAESLSATGNIFVGQTEAPLLIKEYLPKMNKSEIMLVMTGGMATIAGGVLAIYIGLLGGADPLEQMLFAKHLISASVMAAPGAVVAAKMLVPQTEKIDSEIAISKEKVGSNFLEAITNGTGQGIRLAVNVAAMLLVFIALIAMLNFILGKLGDWTTLNHFIANLTDGQYEKFSMQFILGYMLAPLTWVMGVCTEDIALIGQLLGEKTILNEMIAFISLRDYIDSGVFHEQKSIIMATYMLCGFANFSSIGIQLGGIGALAPSKKTTLSQLGFRALVGGTIASLLSATIVGIIVG